jgi:ribosomal protein L37AE/L43A
MIYNEFNSLLDQVNKLSIYNLQGYYKFVRNSFSTELIRNWDKIYGIQRNKHFCTTIWFENLKNRSHLTQNWLCQPCVTYLATWESYLTRQAMYVKHNIEGHLCNHCCHVKAIRIKYYECVSVAFGIQHAVHMHHIVISGPASSTVFFHFYLIKLKKSYWI